MAKKPRGITPENLRNLIAHLEGLPVVEPENIQSKDAIGQNYSKFRTAMDNGYSIDKLVDIYNQYGSEIQVETFAAHLRNAVTNTNVRKTRTARKGKGSSEQKTGSRGVDVSDCREVIGTPAEGAEPVTDTNDEASICAPDADAVQIQKASENHTLADEDAAVDEILAQREMAKAIGFNDG